MLSTTAVVAWGKPSGTPWLARGLGGFCGGLWPGCTTVRGPDRPAWVGGAAARRAVAVLRERLVGLRRTIGQLIQLPAFPAASDASGYEAAAVLCRHQNRRASGMPMRPRLTVTLGRSVGLGLSGCS